TFENGGELQPDTPYGVYIEAGFVVSLSGTPLAVQDHSDWTFTTAATMPPLEWSGSFAATVIASDELSVDVEFEVEADEAFTAYYAITESAITLSPEQILDGTASVLHNEQSFTGSGKHTLYVDINTLNKSTVYYINVMAKSNSTNYSTVDKATFRTYMSISYQPVDKASDVSTTIEPVITFSEIARYKEAVGSFLPIDETNVVNYVKLRKTGQSNDIAYTPTVNTASGFTTITIDPVSELDGNTDYTITLENVCDMPGRTYSGTSSFKTEDLVAPFISSSDPANGAVNVTAYPLIVTVTFNEHIENIDGTPIPVAPATAGMVQYFQKIEGDELTDFTGYSDSYDGNLTLTITLNDELEFEAEYIIVLKSFQDINGHPYEGDSVGRSIRFTVKENDLLTWTGANDTAWRNVLNWMDKDGNEADYYPNGHNVLIQGGKTNYPVIDQNTFVADITIEAGASLTHTGGDFTVSRMFRMKSSGMVNASYINTGGTLIVPSTNVYIEQVMTNAATQSYTISSPVAGATEGSLGIPRLLTFDNSTGGYAELDGPMQTGIGYWARVDKPLIIFSGAINNESEYNVAVHRSLQGFGWNQVGNPYPAALDWSLVEKDNIEDAFWMWLHEQGQYGVLGGESGVGVNLNGSQIPSNHSFLVKVKDNDINEGSITFGKNALVRNETTYLRSGQTRQQLPHVKVAGINGKYSDEAAIVFAENAIDGVDIFDAEKYFSTSADLIELYTYAAEMKSAINGLPFTDEMEIPLCFSVKKAGNFSIKLTANHTEALNVILIDKLNSQETDITNGEMYSFSVAETGQNESRFALKFKGESVNIGKHDPSKFSVKVFTKNRTVCVNVPAMNENRIAYSLFDINGRLINEGFLISETLNNIEVSMSGIYILAIKGTKYLNNYKVVVK
ncbi:MAG: Ig-like domain-containing protein, partial [Cytophagaceae bacterium]|nr:Ig-like domain-containing protein [Cytophagaceae bacterium]